MDEKIIKNVDLFEIMHLINLLKYNAMVYGSTSDTKLIDEMDDLKDRISEKLLKYLDM